MNMEKFFAYDLKIKQILYNIQPREEYRYNKETLMQYFDYLYKAISDIEFYITKIALMYFSDEIEYLKKYFEALQNKLINISLDYNKLKLFYETYFSNMSENLVNEVGENCVGYSLVGGVSLSKANSINELLHIIHQTIINNRNNFQQMEVINSKKNINGEDIILYGKLNYISLEIYNNFDMNISSGPVDIVSLNNKVIMMIRDRGHALSIEIESENDKFYVRYFIPKICNVEMVNELEGVKRVHGDSKYTIGIFECTIDNLVNKLNNFISKVPTDEDMFRYGGRYYEDDGNKTL